LAVELVQWACALDPVPDPASLDQLARHLHVLFDLTADQDVIRQAIEARRTALELLDEDAPGRPYVQGGPCAVLSAYGRLQDLTALDEALTRLRHVIDHPALDPSVRPGWIWNLGTVLRDRGQLASDGGSISEAMSVHEWALHEAAEHPDPGVDVFEIR